MGPLCRCFISTVRRRRLWSLFVLLVVFRGLYCAFQNSNYAGERKPKVVLTCRSSSNYLRIDFLKSCRARFCRITSKSKTEPTLPSSSTASYGNRAT